jgi:hypothetical protein
VRGSQMAYLEMSLTIARTLWYYDFEKASGEAGKLGGGSPGAEYGRRRPDEFQVNESFVVDHDGPNLVLVPRGDYWKEPED